MISEIVAVFFIMMGSFFMVAATVGIIRMPDFYTRMHAMTKGTTLGLAGILLASVFTLQSTEITIKVVLAIAFHFLSNPVGAHMLARAAYHHLNVKFWKNTILEEWKETVHDWNN